MLLTDVPKEESVVISDGRYAAEVLADGFDTHPAEDGSWTLPLSLIHILGFTSVHMRGGLTPNFLSTNSVSWFILPARRALSLIHISAGP